MKAIILRSVAPAHPAQDPATLRSLFSLRPEAPVAVRPRPVSGAGAGWPALLLAFVLSLFAGAEARAAIGFRSASSANNGSSTLNNLVINKPSGVVDGDFMVAQVSATASVTITGPSGWTLVRTLSDSVLRSRVYWKIAGSSEPASYTWTFSQGAKSSGGIVAFTGVDETTPIQVENGAVEGTTQTTHTTPTIATTGSSTWLVSLFADRRSTGTGSTWTSSGATERVDTASTGDSNCSTAIYTQGPVSADNYSRTGTASNSSGTATMQIVALNAGVASEPEINVTGNSVTIADGDTTPTTADHTDFGNAELGGGAVTRTFTIQNTGAASLSVGTVSISGPNQGAFDVTAQPASSVAASGSTTFNVRFMPSGDPGVRSATVSFTNGDADESPYDFGIQGTGASTAEIAFRAASQASSGSVSGTSLAIDKPTGVVDGDVMIAGISVSNIDSVITPPTGWTLIRSVTDGTWLHTATYWKEAGASEPSSYTWNFSVQRYLAGGIVAFSGVDGTTPIQAEDGAEETGSATTSHTTPTIATSGSGTWLLSVFGDRTTDGSTWTTPTGATERVDITTSASTNPDPSVSIHHQGPVSAGSYSHTATASSSDDEATMTIIALNPGNGDGSGGNPPAAPSSLSATAVSSSQINLSWTDNCSEENGFKIERKTGAGGSYAQIDTVGANTTSYNDTELAAGTTYYYRVRSFNGAGDSSYSNEANATTSGTPPAAPSSLSATAVSSSQINLSWTDNAGNETGFKIERKTGAGGTYSQIDTAGANATSYNSTGLTSSTTYCYRVRSYNGSGNSAYSNEANATTQSGGSTPDLPFFGQYYGSAMFGGTSAANSVAKSATEQGSHFFFYAERTGTVTQIRQHWRQATGYSAGDGGKYTIEIRAANASTLAPLTGVSPICKIDNVQPGNSGPTTNVTYTFTTQGQLVAKQPYCIIYRNTHASPGSNYVSTNIGLHFAFDDNSGGDYEEPTGANPISPGSSPTSVSGWTPVYIDGTTKWYPWPAKGGNGSRSYRRLGPMFAVLKYSDGQWTGWGGWGGGGSYKVPINGNNQMRQRFRVTRADRVVTGVFLRLGRINASGGNLVVTLESGPASDTSGNGTQIEQITVPASTVYNVGSSEANNQVSAGSNVDFVPFLWVPFSQARTLSEGSLYNLRLHQTNSGSFSMWCSGNAKSGTNLGVSGPSLTWDQWEAQREVEWGAWEDSRNLMISSNSGSSWSFTTPKLPPIIFKCQ